MKLSNLTIIKNSIGDGYTTAPIDLFNKIIRLKIASKGKSSEESPQGVLHKEIESTQDSFKLLNEALEKQSATIGSFLEAPYSMPTDKTDFKRSLSEYLEVQLDYHRKILEPAFKNSEPESILFDDYKSTFMEALEQGDYAVMKASRDLIAKIRKSNSQFKESTTQLYTDIFDLVSLRTIIMAQEVDKDLKLYHEFESKVKELITQYEEKIIEEQNKVDNLEKTYYDFDAAKSSMQKSFVNILYRFSALRSLNPLSKDQKNYPAHYQLAKEFQRLWYETIKQVDQQRIDRKSKVSL